MGYIYPLLEIQGEQLLFSIITTSAEVRIESRLTGKGKPTEQRIGAPEKKRAQEKSEKL